MNKKMFFIVMLVVACFSPSKKVSRSEKLAAMVTNTATYIQPVQIGRPPYD